MNRIKLFAKRIIYGGSRRYCAVCGLQARAFKAFGSPLRNDAICPFCGSFERHRLVISFLRQKTDLFDGALKTMLHVAPEPCFQSLFRNAVGDGYLTADLHGRGVMEQMDITEIRHRDASFDVIFCSHVLEHVVDDRRAMRELFRVLKVGGWAVLNVPVIASETFEDPAVTDPVERERLFGQFDHVRAYGPDYRQRLEEAGFRVSVFCPEDLLESAEVMRHGLGACGAGEIFYCRKAV